HDHATRSVGLDARPIAPLRSSLPQTAEPGRGMTELLRADAVVIGSGAGGAPVAWALAEAGLEVLVLEAGERFETKDFAGDEGALVSRLMPATTVADGGLEVYAGACVGGSSVVNDALCLRPPPEILESWRRDHGLAGLADADS